MKTPNLSRSELDHIIDEWVFNERDRAILRRRLFDGIIYEQLADEFGLSVRQVKNIVHKSEIRLFTHVQ